MITLAATILSASLIQADINTACANEGGVVQVGPAWYHVTAPLTIPCNGITLQGVSSQSSHFFSLPGDPVPSMLVIGGPAGNPIGGVTLASLNFNGGIAAPSTRVGISINHAVRITLRDVLVDHVQTGLVMGSPGGSDAGLLKIYSSRFGTWGDGLQIYGTSGLWVVDTHFNGNAPRGSGTRGIAILDGFDTGWIRDSITETHDTGLWIGCNDTSKEIWDLWISGFVADRVKRAGIEIGGTARVQSVQITNSWVSGGDYGFVVYQPGPMATTRISFTGNHVNAADLNAIWIGGQVSGVAMAGNVLAHGAAYAGIWINGSGVAAPSNVVIP